MIIAILASNENLYSHKRLIEEGEKRGHKVKFLRITECYMNISASKPDIHYAGGETLKKIDAVIPRIRPSITYYGTAVLRQFEMQGVFALNGNVSILRSRDKLRTLQILSRKGIDMPITCFAHSPQKTKNLIKMVGGSPLIIKLLESAQGVGVVLAETNKAAESVINAFKSLKAHILVQEFIKESEGTDIRCFVIGDEVVASMQRKAHEGEFKANIHLGATATPIEITDQERKLALDASRIIGLQVAGVDIIRSKTGPKILEVNSSPGLQGIEGATKVNIAGKMIEFIEQNWHHKPDTHAG